MIRFTQILENNNSYVEVKSQPLNTELVYICESGGQVGSLLLVFNGKEASIYSVEVLPTHRGKGYGKRLVESAIEACKQKSCNFIELNTEVDNTVANNLYQSLGFELMGNKFTFNNYRKYL
jgi:ribosomal protein S18 acetylase RimI-like enzyme